MKRYISSTLVIMLAGLLAFSGSTQHATAQTPNRGTAVLPGQSQIHDRQILVELQSNGDAKSASAAMASKGVSMVDTLSLSYTDYMVVRVPDGDDYEAVFRRLENDPNIRSVTPNVVKHISEYIPNDPLFLGTASDVESGLASGAGSPALSNQWGLLISGAQDAWEVTTGKNNIVVAVLDTGAKLDHEDLKNRLWNNPGEAKDGTDTDGNGFVDDVHGYDFQGYSLPVGGGAGSGGDGDPTDEEAKSADTVFDSHGTSTASIVAGQTNNGVGMSGVAGGNTPSSGVRLMICRVGTASTISLAAEIGAIDYAVNNGAHVITMSFGGESGGDAEENAINRAWNAGVYVCAAAGNYPQGAAAGVDLPAGFDNCVAVGATTIFSPDSVNVGPGAQVVSEYRPSYSKTGPEVEICAPGTRVISAAWGGSNATVDGYMDSFQHQFTGTSAATPVVAGLAALLYSVLPDPESVTANQTVRDRINSTAKDLGQAGRDEQFGFGRIEMGEALAAFATGKDGDANGDGFVDEADLALIIANYGKRSTDAGYTAQMDLNSDGVIDELDVLEIGKYYEAAP
ncbi:MAG: S8 family serine peptidase [Planctomycetales bacterium]|nr:S8 family serine peptidase [bacterium]UNM07687.1 MAG: S8 family serine peptidase [Planctomycetales bacterium]